MINRAVALKAAVFSPEMICSAVILLTKAPKDATPIAPPTCRAALSTAEATPSLEAEDKLSAIGVLTSVRWGLSDRLRRKLRRQPMANV